MLLREMAGITTPSRSDLLCAAIQQILKDDGFDLTSEPASTARLLAERYLEWFEKEENQQEIQSFCDDL